MRNVNGFLGGEWNEYQGYVAVRAGDAHSWDEVFFPGVRGVISGGNVRKTSKPAGSGPADRRSSTGEGLVSSENTV